jgi:hypothetical protein
MVQALARRADHFRRYSESRHSLAPQYQTQWVGKRSLCSQRRDLRIRTSIEPASRWLGNRFSGLAIWKNTMTEASPLTSPGNSASLLLGRTIDSIPFSAYHLQLILGLGAVGFVEGYDLALGGSLLVLAKQPLHLTPEQIRWLAVAPILLVVVGAYTASAISDRVSRKTAWR